MLRYFLEQARRLAESGPSGLEATTTKIREIETAELGMELPVAYSRKLYNKLDIIVHQP